MSDELRPALPADELSFVGKAAYLFVPDYDVVVYGSRARHDHHKFSDIDIAVFGAPEPFDVDVTRLYEVLRNAQLTNTPKIIQISEHKSERFVRNVLEDGILVWEGCGDFRCQRLAEGFAETPQPVFNPANAISTTSKSS